jgi:hypothetical protein
MRERREHREDLFGVDAAADRELVDTEEAARIAGETVNAFLTGVETGLYPKWHGWPDVKRQYVWTPRGWKKYPRWRRGDVIAAVARRNERSPFGRRRD